MHAGGRRWSGGRLRGGRRVLLHTDREPGQRHADDDGPAADHQLLSGRVERHQHVQRGRRETVGAASRQGVS